MAGRPLPELGNFGVELFSEGMIAKFLIVI